MKDISFFKRFSLLLILVICISSCVSSPNILLPREAPAVAPLKKPVEVALVLGGGGARGFAHVGVLKVLQDAGVPIDMVVGTSAGSIVGAFYADSKDANTVKQIMLNSSFSDFVDISLSPFKAPITGNELQRFILRHSTARNFDQLRTKFIAVATDVNTGKAVILESGPIAPAVNASAAIPPALRPVELYGHTLIDGSMVEPIPVSVALKYHPKVVIAVNVSRDLPDKAPGSDYQIYQRGILITWQTLNTLSAKGADVVIHPLVGNTGLFGIKKKEALYETGVKAATDALPDILKVLAEKGIKTRHVPQN